MSVCCCSRRHILLACMGLWRLLASMLAQHQLADIIAGYHLVHTLLICVSTTLTSWCICNRQVLNAVAMANAAALPSDADLSVDLDWRPSLSATQEIVCWSCAAITACVVYLFTAPAGVSIPYATCIGLLFGLVLYTLRNALLEELYKVRRTRT